MVACGIWEYLFGRNFQTFLPWDTLVPSDSSGSVVIAFLVFFSYAIVMNTVVPISLYVSVEVNSNFHNIIYIIVVSKNNEK